MLNISRKRIEGTIAKFPQDRDSQIFETITILFFGMNERFTFPRKRVYALRLFLVGDGEADVGELVCAVYGCVLTMSCAEVASLIEAVKLIEVCFAGSGGAARVGVVTIVNVGFVANYPVFAVEIQPIAAVLQLCNGWFPLRKE